MVERVFLGWDRPFLARAVEWLLERREELPGMLVVLPTAQGGRRLREALAEVAGAVLSPQVVTPGSFLQSRDDGAAADWAERVAWVEVLEEVTDWAEFEALFPEAPIGSNWANGIAREMVTLRRSLQENGLFLATAARSLSETVEAERWQALGILEDRVERKLKSWGLQSRSGLLAEGLTQPAGFTRIVLAGVADLPPLVERALAGWNVTVLVGAPESEAAGFSASGRPLASWAVRPQPWPEGSVQVVADPRQQAVEALRVIGECQTPSDAVALGSADGSVGDELARAFTREGWPAFHPAGALVTRGLARWFTVWSGWLVEPTLEILGDLLTLPETGVLIGGGRAQKAKRLAELRDRWMVARTEDLQRRIAAEVFRTDLDRQTAADVLDAATTLEGWRASFLGADAAGAISRVLEIQAKRVPEEAAEMADWLAAAVPVMQRVSRSAGFWIELMLSDLPARVETPPEGRVIDVQGWLELFHEPGRHLVLCGMNEGKIPARGGGEPWLGEASRTQLGLITDANRAARDAFLYRAMIEARRDGGRVDVICGKTGAGGESLLPSRLLLAADRDELPGRVKALFKEIEPPEAGLRWQADWQWAPRHAVPPQRLNVTSLGDYLKCPFRYYLKHVLRMCGSEPQRAEWDARDFGNVAHEVLERWGRDTEAREYEKTEAIHGWLSAELDRVVREWFGKRVPLAVRIQTEALRQRLEWLARRQAVTRVEGWEIVDVERKVEIPAGGVTIIAKIDRVDRHRDSGRLRVLDYKTGKVDAVDKAHRKKLTTAATLPGHLSRDCPAVYGGIEKNKPAEFLWHNLQLPLYAAGLYAQGGPLPTPCYFTVCSTQADVDINEWPDFEEADLASARACADWVTGRIAAQVFWPPAERIKYDDYAALAAGRPFEEMFQEIRDDR